MGDLTVTQAPTSLTSVSGTTAFGGPATLMATLTSTVTDLGIAGETIDFTLDGVPVGTAVTDSSGVATLTEVPTSDPAGTDPGGVVANFGGDVNYQSSQGVGRPDRLLTGNETTETALWTSSLVARLARMSISLSGLSKSSPADGMHQSLGLDEPGGVDLVPFPLAEHARPDGQCNCLIARV